MDILTGKKLSSIKVANMDLIYWTVHLTSRRGEDWVKWMDMAYRYFSQREYHFIRVYKNLEQDPSNNPLCEFS